MEKCTQRGEADHEYLCPQQIDLSNKDGGIMTGRTGLGQFDTHHNDGVHIVMMMFAALQRSWPRGRRNIPRT